MNAPSSTTASRWLAATEAVFRRFNIETPRLDSLVLLSDELGRDKVWILAHPEFILQGSILENLSTKVAQRAQHIPLAYIRGKTEFYGREFAVNEYVLVPRPESEAMIELLKKTLNLESGISIFDIGTGSGALAITAKLEVSTAEVIAIDIDEKCLAVARKNAQNLGADITLLQGDLLQPLQDSRFQILDSIILANLPYVPNDYPVNKAAAHEPCLALFSGADGLDHYRTLFEQLEALAIKPLHVITESLASQHAALTDIAMNNGYFLAKTDGLAQRFSTTK